MLEPKSSKDFASPERQAEKTYEYARQVYRRIIAESESN